jgi:NADPH:quinone reductase-like Zn-dependent oxidoreductase
LYQLGTNHQGSSCLYFLHIVLRTVKRIEIFMNTAAKPAFSGITQQPLAAGQAEVAIEAFALCPYAEVVMQPSPDGKKTAPIVALGAAGVVTGLPAGKRGNAGSRIREGDEVWMRTGFTSSGSVEKIILPTAELFPVPMGISMAQAATLGDSALLALAALRDHHVGKGTRFLVHGGANPFGHAAIALANVIGAEVAATVDSQAEIAIARDASARLVVVARARDAMSSLKQWAGESGANIIFDSALSEHMEINVELLALDGVISTCPLQGRAGVVHGMEMLAKKNGQIRFLSHAALDKHDLSEIANAINKAIQASQYRPLVGQVIPPNGIADALTRIARGRLIGNVVIQPTATHVLRTYF